MKKKVGFSVAIGFLRGLILLSAFFLFLMYNNKGCYGKMVRRKNFRL